MTKPLIYVITVNNRQETTGNILLVVKLWLCWFVKWGNTCSLCRCYDGNSLSCLYNHLTALSQTPEQSVYTSAHTTHTPHSHCLCVCVRACECVCTCECVYVRKRERANVCCPIERQTQPTEMLSRHILLMHSNTFLFLISNICNFPADVIL